MVSQWCVGKGQKTYKDYGSPECAHAREEPVAHKDDQQRLLGENPCLACDCASHGGYMCPRWARSQCGSGIELSANAVVVASVSGCLVVNYSGANRIAPLELTIAQRWHQTENRGRRLKRADATCH